MKSLQLVACLVALAAPLPAVAASYTYTIDYDFPMLREGNNLGAFADPIAGRGSLTGQIVLDDSFLTTRTLVSYSLTTTNSSTRSNVENSYSFSSTDTAETFAFVGPDSVFDPYIDLVFNDQSYAQPCSPTSPTAIGGQYSIAGSRLVLQIGRNFTPGDAGFAMRAYENFGRTAYCYRAGYPFNEHEHTGPNNSTVFAALTSTNPGVGGVSEVPLPAGLPLLAAGVAALGFVKGRRKLG